jgi:DNA mismatch endonuclease (patch repair protein)
MNRQAAVADIVDSITRSRMMAGIRGVDTRPELVLRRALHRSGFRYRLHVANLPGRPDLVLPGRRAVIFVHGCFWHRHEGCHWCTTPAANASFWRKKFGSNVDRDRRHADQLRADGWRVAVVWECALRAEATSTIAQLESWLRSTDPAFETPLIRKRVAAGVARRARPKQPQE